MSASSKHMHIIYISAYVLNAYVLNAHVLNAPVLNAHVLGAYVLNAYVLNAHVMNAYALNAYVLNAYVLTADFRGVCTPFQVPQLEVIIAAVMEPLVDDPALLPLWGRVWEYLR